MSLPLLVAVFVDLENVGGHVLRDVRTYSAGLGRICHFAVYADWRGGRASATAWNHTLELGGVPKQVLRSGGKNSADISIVIDIMDFLYQSPEVGVFVLVTGDSDFVPLAQRLRARGKWVHGVAPTGSSVSSMLIPACDAFWYLPEAEQEPKPSPPPVVAPTKGPSLAEVREAVAELLRSRGTQKAGSIGTMLRRQFPQFHTKAYGHANLSKLLQAQGDLLQIARVDGHELEVSLVGAEAAAVDEDATATAAGGSEVAAAEDTPPRSRSRSRSRAGAGNRRPGAKQPAFGSDGAASAAAATEAGAGAEGAAPPARPARTRKPPRQREGAAAGPQAPTTDGDGADSLLMRMQIPLLLLDPPLAVPPAAPPPADEPARLPPVKRDVAAAAWNALQHGVLGEALPELGWPALLQVDEAQRAELVRAALQSAGKSRTTLSWLVQGAAWLAGQRVAELGRRLQRTPDLVFDGVPGFGAVRSKRALAAWQAGL